MTVPMLSVDGQYPYSSLLYIALFPGGCGDGDMRLIDGVTEYDGVVEICRNNVWGLITLDANFSQIEAGEICNQLDMPHDCEKELLLLLTNHFLEILVVNN